MDPLQLGWEPLVTSWMQTCLPDFMTNEQRDTIRVGGQCKNWHDCVVKVVDKVYRGCSVWLRWWTRYTEVADSDLVSGLKTFSLLCP